ncbi:hypothetical protein Z946_3395 [Sulfitobacter noctilucicola]|uniref:Outer membrane protein beta-barrel domain-containing protein n=1 Tax=Sulfitobacter noctilucicola TaxID=1342301 RepID=A0A7W6Q456_9RHOB|nr:hypothetical protein [Sulfitobacter noctilucicola]KIN64503.1 hypothetical protein Z946_3395 [Sulfitobacter noctilucicola]MBB4174338.1 hypothetical protein [Sulfitobacter noctilucicola]
MLHSRFIAVTLFSLAALPATAQTVTDSGLGIIGADLRLGFSNQEIEGGYVGGTVDVAITHYHGAQFDLQYEERSTGGIGRIGTTLYMTPRVGQKYGLSLMMADKNDVSSTYGQISAVGMFTAAEDFNIELRAGGGLSADNDLDWITAGIGAHWSAGANTQIYGHYDIAEFDEETFGAYGHEVTFGIKTAIKGTPATVFAEATRDWLSGANSADGDTTLRAGISIALGRTGNNQPSFRISDPMRQILRRGLY